MLQQGVRPDMIVHATSSGGTQAGLVAGCALHGLSTRVIGVSADDPAADVERQVRSIIAGMEALIGSPLRRHRARRDVRGRRHVRRADGYGVPTPASVEAQRLAARTEALFVDHTYTAKAFAALIARLRDAVPTRQVLFGIRAASDCSRSVSVSSRAVARAAGR
jgi:1-aminocyclopropane-1-carboxylate deaminase/D-cysteine desulfhydrase-like pyridoxal-dependent ACC family enzyme